MDTNGIDPTVGDIVIQVVFRLRVRVGQVVRGDDSLVLNSVCPRDHQHGGRHPRRTREVVITENREK